MSDIERDLFVSQFTGKRVSDISIEGEIKTYVLIIHFTDGSHVKIQNPSGSYVEVSVFSELRKSFGGKKNGQK